MAKKLLRLPLTCMIISPDAERIHMALMAGATASAMGRPVTFFFSKAAVKFLTVEGRASLHNSEGMPLADMDARLDDRGVADTGVLLDALASLDVQFLVCETALREHGIDHADLINRPALEISGLAHMLERGQGGDWLTF